jgi:hypothetical protein
MKKSPTLGGLILLLAGAVSGCSPSDFLLFAPSGRADMIAGSGGPPGGRVFTGLHLSMNRGITHAESPH